MGTSEATEWRELAELLSWVRQQAGELLDCGDAWQITIHGGPAGDVKTEVIRKRVLLATNKERRQHGSSNGRL